MLIAAATGNRLGGSAGKTHQRAAFFVAIPSHLDSQTPFFHDLHSKLVHLMGEKNAAEYFLPEVAVGPSSWTVRAEHMPIARAQLVLREAPHNLGHKSEANTATTYSLRRFLPTVGDSLQLTCSERSSSGNWTDQTSLTEISPSTSLELVSTAKKESCNSTCDSVPPFFSTSLRVPTKSSLFIRDQFKRNSAVSFKTRRFGFNLNSAHPSTFLSKVTSSRVQEQMTLIGRSNK